MKLDLSEKSYSCTKCKTTFVPDEENSVEWYGYNIQKGLQKEVFCSAECLQVWAKSKKTSMWISLLAGAVLTALFASEIGTTAVILFFIPYMIRHYHNSLKNTVKNGWIGEFFSFALVFLSSMTFVYPINKLLKEANEYKRITAYISEKGGLLHERK